MWKEVVFVQRVKVVWGVMFVFGAMFVGVNAHEESL